MTAEVPPTPPPSQEPAMDSRRLANYEAILTAASDAVKAWTEGKSLDLAMARLATALTKTERRKSPERRNQE